MGRKTEKSYVTFIENFLRKIDSEAEEKKFQHEKSKSKRIHKLSKSSLIARHSKESLKGNKLEGNPWNCAAEIKGR